MIDVKRKRKSLFGSQPFNPEAMPAGLGQPIDQMIAPTQEAEKPSFFGRGGTGRAIAGNIGDTLLQMSNMAPIYNPAMQQRAAMESQEQLAEAKRLAGREDFMFKENYMRENAAPDSTAMQQNYEYLQGVDPDLAQSYLKRQTDPIQWITGPDGVPRPYGVGGSAAPTAPVGKLTPIAGGAGSNASGGFPKG